MDLTGDVSELQSEGFKVGVDKGTYDAISLGEEGEVIRKRYITSLASILANRGSLYVITSCNWTEEELIRHFSPGKQVLFFVKCHKLFLSQSHITIIL